MLKLSLKRDTTVGKTPNPFQFLPNPLGVCTRKSSSSAVGKCPTLQTLANGCLHCDGMQRKHLKSTPPGHQATCPGTNFSPRKLWSFCIKGRTLDTKHTHKDSSFGRFYSLVRRSNCRHWDLAGISHGGNRQPGNFNVSIYECTYSFLTKPMCSNTHNNSKNKFLRSYRHI